MGVLPNLATSSMRMSTRTLLWRFSIVLADALIQMGGIIGRSNSTRQGAHYNILNPAETPGLHGSACSNSHQIPMTIHRHFLHDRLPCMQRANLGLLPCDTVMAVRLLPQGRKRCRELGDERNEHRAVRRWHCVPCKHQFQTDVTPMLRSWTPLFHVEYGSSRDSFAPTSLGNLHKREGKLKMKTILIEPVDDAVVRVTSMTFSHLRIDILQMFLRQLDPRMVRQWSRMSLQGSLL